VTGQATRDFEIEIHREWLAMLDKMRELVIYIATEGLAGVQEKSPVDIGTFRANWLISIGSPSDRTTMSLSEFGAMNAQALASYAGKDGWPVIYLQNSLPYALRLENGWSKQAPGGVLALTVNELEAIANSLGSRI
jgi:hypothetical protein